ncbi:ornithine carbamoyltransferase [Clostridium luticellarii]|uniref:Ornithine carbamoyltransferase n=1 Tax=Clostridium luticellarii TaxID=1691940 RepID=A0A2T0BLB6_9CLOT|nr:ornithine carbamoyltransferase [Clostridium luticellarii]PRR84667.1 Ornithine carbamoyltransferase [Clostridium luticellarii]
MADLKGRSFLTLKDFSQQEIKYLLELSKKLKEEKYSGSEKKRLQGKNIALIFEKDSLRTRCSFQVGAYDQGATVTYIGPTGSHMGKKESVKDTARVMGRMFDAVEYRGFSQKNMEIFAEYSKVPLWNGLSDEDHPTQVLADFLTVEEHIDKPLKDVNFIYIGDGRNNMANALMIGASKMGMNFKIIAPRELFPEDQLVKECKEISEQNGGHITISDDVYSSVKGADVLYTDVWLSMGEEKGLWKNRIKTLMPYQINEKLIEACGNKDVKFMHCLPAFHNRETDTGEDIYQKFGYEALEVTEEVFEGKHSIVFDEAENRLHTIKAVMVATLSGPENN